jgi:hypothetical protein
MFLQFAPVGSHVSHWYWNVIGAEPFQVPGLAVRCSPTVAVPLIVGGVEFVGATAADFDVAARLKPARASAGSATAATAMDTSLALRGRERDVLVMSRPPMSD